MRITFKNINKSLRLTYLNQHVNINEYQKFIESLKIYFNYHNSNESEEHKFINLIANRSQEY